MLSVAIDLDTCYGLHLLDGIGCEFRLMLVDCVHAVPDGHSVGIGGIHFAY